MNRKPLMIDLFCGLGGWAEGGLAAGYEVIGFDIERHVYETGWDFLHECPFVQKYPAHLVLQDALTLHGRQFKDVVLIVASPPCQKYSYMAMPWSKGKALAQQYRASASARTELNALFDACFRIQREASEAAGRHIPMVVENVKGAQPWVGSAKWHYGSFYLWGDVPALMPFSGSMRKSQHEPLCETPNGTGKTSWFFGNSKHEGRFYGVDAVKVPSESGRRTDVGKGARFTSRDCGAEGTKNSGGSWFNQAHNTESGAGKNPVNGVKNGNDWFGSGDNCSAQRHASFRSHARKAASAQIAKIPFPLAEYIASFYFPEDCA